jgi:hypothetical protein
MYMGLDACLELTTISEGWTMGGSSELLDKVRGIPAPL